MEIHDSRRGMSPLPVVAMVSAVTALAINAIISKLAMSRGVSFFALSVLSNAIATVILFPAAFFVHRCKGPNAHSLSFSVLWRVFLLASFGCFSELSSYAGINYSSPTLSTAMLNLVPAFTYVLAVIFRIEEVNFGSLSTISKSLGTLVSISGAFVVTFYKGPAIINAPLTQVFLLSTQNWVLGGFLLACASFSVAAWCILQAGILKMYPSELMVVAFYCFFVMIQSSIVSVIVVRDLSAWRIETKIGLIAILYSAIMNIAYRLYVTSWCIWKMGPLFVSLFKPITVVVAVVIGVVFMKEALYLGSILGALVLVVGFYAVMWGKAREGRSSKGTEPEPEPTGGVQAPLLQENIEQV